CIKQSIMRRFFNIMLIVLGLTGGSVIPAMAATAPTTDDHLFSVCDINGKTAKSPICPDRNIKTNPANHLIKVATDIVALATGAAAVILIIISGIRFITAGGASPGQRAGDPNAIKSARATLTAAIIGLIIVAMAWTIISFVTDKFIL